MNEAPQSYLLGLESASFVVLHILLRLPFLVQRHLLSQLSLFTLEVKHTIYFANFEGQRQR